MINYYHRFIPRAAEILTPLFDALTAKELSWSDSCELAFTKAKDS